jgi:hypothetical protein
MQVSATLIAAQQAAREARARLQMPQQSQPVSFTASLEDSQGFSALPLKQTAAPAAQSQQIAQATPARMGTHLNIVV